MFSFCLGEIYDLEKFKKSTPTCKERIECSMIDYGKKKSTVRPEELELTHWIRSHRHSLRCVKSMK